MNFQRRICCLLILFLAPVLACAADAVTMSEIIATSKLGDWRGLDPENTIYIELPAGRVVVELAPDFAPRHVANVKALARENYFDGLAIVRAQDNYVVQFADPEAENPKLARKIAHAAKTLPAEFDRGSDPKIPFTPLSDADVYADEVGFSKGFSVARDKRTGKMWLVHTYGMLGAGRDNAADSGGGTELYVVIGHAPRQLDRNVTLLGRVIQGMELLSILPRGPAPMGFYTNAQQRVPIKSIRVAADVSAAERSTLEVMRTDTQTFTRLVESRRNRREDWFKFQAGKIDVGNVPVPVRTVLAKVHAPRSANATDEGWRALPLITDGKVDNAWCHVGWGGFVVDGDALRAEPDPKGLGLLVYQKEKFGNCQIRVVFKAKEAKSNSGVFVRIADGVLGQTNTPGATFDRDARGKISRLSMQRMMQSADREEGPWFAVHRGYEIQIMEDNDKFHRTGAIYSLAPSAAVPDMRSGEWKTMVITLAGNRILVDVQGQRVTSFDPDTAGVPGDRKWFEPKRESKRPETGYIGLQNHDPGDIVWFREVSVRSVAEPAP